MLILFLFFRILEESNKILPFKNFTFGYIEPEKNIIELTARLFDVNILLFSIDGSLNIQNKNNSLTANKRLFCSESDSDYKETQTPTICLFYFLNKFSCFYGKEYYVLYKDILQSYSSYVKEVIFKENNFKCSSCNKKDNNQKVYFRSQMVSGCIECIKQKAEEELFNRWSNLQKDFFLSRECI